MVTGIEWIRYQTKNRPNEHQKLPYKIPLVAIIDEFIRCYVRNKANTSLYIQSAIFIDVALCSLNQLKMGKSVFTFTCAGVVNFQFLGTIQALNQR